MARQVLPIVGAVVGAYFGNPQLGYAIGSLVGNAVDPEVIQGPKIGDAGVQTSAEGVPRPVVFGTAPVVGNVIMRGNRQIRKVKEGGKGGPVTESERVSWTFAIRIAEGKIAAVTRIWEEEKLVYDITPGSTIGAESDRYAQKFRLYLGDEAQLPDPDLEVIKGAGNVNAYRGTAYIVFPNFDLTDYRERIPTFRMEVVAAVDVTLSGWVMTASNPSGQVREGHKIYRSGDLVNWTGPFDRAPNPIDYPTFGPIRVADGLLIAGGGNVIEKSVDLSFDTGFAITKPTITGATGISRIRPFGDIVVALANPGNEYWTSSDAGATWTKRTSPNSPANGGIIDVARIDLGEGFTRWVACLSDGPSTRFIYSDSQGEPATWNDAISVGPNIATISGSISCNGESAAFLGTNGRIARTLDGVTWEHSFTLSPERSGGRDAIQGGATLMIATEGAANGVCYSKNNGATWELVDGPLFQFQVQRLSVGPNAIVASLPNRYIDAGVDRMAAVTHDFGDTWSWLTLPELIASQARIEFYQTSVSSEKVALADIVSALHSRVKQSASKFNVTELTDMVDGVVFAGEYTVSDGIRSLLTPYFADASEYDAGSGWKLHYVKRGKPVVKTLTEDDLVDEPEKSMRESAIEFPAKLHMFFQNPLIGYAPAKATSFRSSPDVRVVGEASVQVPVTIGDVDEAAKIANKLHKVSWAEAEGDTVLTVSDEHLDLVAGDNVGLALRGSVRRLRITKIEDNPGTRKITFRVDRQSAYTSNVTGIPLPAPTPPPPSIVGQTVFEFLDIPALLDTDDALIYYDAAAGTTEAWYGASVQRQDSIGDFSEVNRFNRGSAIGVLLAEVADASEHYTDTTNALRVQFYRDPELDSLTDEQFLSEAGALAVEKPDGTWELVQYRDAEQDSDGNYTLTTLHRGRLNSGASAHEAGARVVVLATVQKVPAVTAMIDTDLTHRAVSFSESPENAVEYTDTYTAKSQSEWPVANLLLDRAGDDVIATAVPRHRFGTEDNPVRSINWTGYRWTATDGTNTVTRETTTDSTTFDVTGWGSPVTVTVAQLNRYTGAGPEVSEEIA